MDRQIKYINNYFIQICLGEVMRHSLILLGIYLSSLDKYKTVLVYIGCFVFLMDILFILRLNRKRCRIVRHIDNNIALMNSRQSFLCAIGEYSDMTFGIITVIKDSINFKSLEEKDYGSFSIDSKDYNSIEIGEEKLRWGLSFLLYKCCRKSISINDGTSNIKLRALDHQTLYNHLITYV